MTWKNRDTRSGYCQHVVAIIRRQKPGNSAQDLAQELVEVGAPGDHTQTDHTTFIRHAATVDKHAAHSTPLGSSTAADVDRRQL